jgi:signal transduction histidine kinase
VTKSQDTELFKGIMSVVADLDLQTTLETIVTTAVNLVEAKYGALGVVSNKGGLQDFFHYGMPENQVKMISHTPEGRGVLGVLVQYPEPIRLTDLSKHPASFGFPENHPPMKTFLGVPVRVRGVVFGNLYLTEKKGGAEFTPEDEELAVGLAVAAGLAIENARLFSKTQAIAVYEDRERIARDLHDLVIQQLFATGMTLESLARRDPDSPEAKKISQAVDDLDHTIKQIRQSIYALTTPENEGVSLRRRVMHEVEGFTVLLGTTPSITFEGPVDSMASDREINQVVAALRELLSNAVRHAQATSVSVVLQIVEDHLALTVSDNGVGIPETVSRSGLENLRKRAESLGGSFETSRRFPTGTQAQWKIPLSN